MRVVTLIACVTSLASVVACSTTNITQIIVQGTGGSTSGGGMTASGGITNPTGTGGATGSGVSTGGESHTGGGTSVAQSTAGQSTAGGAQASGGAVGSGGAAGIGGVTSSRAGSTSSGGNTPIGGTTSAGGATSSGGSSLFGGTSKGGSNATGGGCATSTLFTFDVGAGGFALDTIVGSSVDTVDDSGKGLPYLNLAAPGDAGAVKVPPAIGWSNTQDYIVGNTTKGSLAITAQYTNWNQSVTALVGGLVDSLGNVLDFSNKVISAHVMVAGDGLTVPTNAGGAFLFLKTGSSYTWGQGQWTNISPATGTWQTLSMNTRSPDNVSAGWDPTHPVQFGIEVSSSGGGGSAQAPNAYGAPRNVIIYIDYITVACAP